VIDAFPWARTCPFTPPPEYRDLPPTSQVELPSGQKLWLIAGHEQVRAVLASPDTSSERTNPDFPVLFPAAQQALGTARPKPSYGGMDRPEHTLHRHMIVNEFTVRKVEAMRPKIQRIVDDHIDAMLTGPKPADLVEALALPLPSLVICELLGVPYEDRTDFQQRTQQILTTAGNPEQTTSAFVGLMSYLGTLITAKEQAPGDDLLSRLITKYVTANAYDHAQMISLASGLLIAGHETSANMIALSTVALLRHPDQLADLQRDPALAKTAVEELLRYFSIADIVTARVATADISLGDITIHKGEPLIALGAAANRDPAAFPDPDKLDLHRSARHHVAFGYGIHQCLGQNLARLELEIVLTTLFTRIPDLRLAAPFETLPFKTDAILFGLHNLPVTW
jgi:cytochrome P450